MHFPANGTAPEKLLREISRNRQEDFQWKDGKMFGFVYYPGDEMAEVIEHVFRLYMHDNTLNPTAFGSVRHMENELVAMVGDLLHGNRNTTGSVTSGGTESILMAMKVARDRKREEMPGITPEVIVPATAHPAFDKAAHYLDMKLLHAPVDQDFRVDVAKIGSLVTRRTAMLVGSAPCFPYGVVDPIAGIAELAMRHGLLCHVDACLGGLMLPFLEKLGYPVSAFDFRVKGVTSISADMHKYGYAAKGVSLILYRDPELRKRQFFITTEWPGGIFASNSLLGSKSGGPVAAAWTVVKLMGLKGYMANAAEVMNAVKKIQEGIRETGGLEIAGHPEMSVFAVKSDRYDIHAIGDELTKRGWLTDRLQNPACIHLTVNILQVGKEEDFLDDLGDAVAAAGSQNHESPGSRLIIAAISGLSGLLPEKLFGKLMHSVSRFIPAGGSSSGQRALYGISADIKNRHNLKEMITSIYDKMYRAR